MFTAPTAIRAIQREDPEAVGASKHDISSLRQVVTMAVVNHNLSNPMIV